MCLSIPPARPVIFPLPSWARLLSLLDTEPLCFGHPLRACQLAPHLLCTALPPPHQVLAILWGLGGPASPSVRASLHAHLASEFLDRHGRPPRDDPPDPLGPTSPHPVLLAPPEPPTMAYDCLWDDVGLRWVPFSELLPSL